MTSVLHSHNINYNPEFLMNNSEYQPIGLNFGPQHPATHGVLRCIINLVGEVVTKADPHIGLLHRGTEKLIEHKTVLQALPYFDRLDYVSMMAQEHCFSMASENLLNEPVSIRIQSLRTIFLEITRILNHLMAVTTHAMDVGAITPFLWAFEEREKLMELYERASGARMHANYIRPGGVVLDVPASFFIDLLEFSVNFNNRLDEMEELLTFNRIWKQRLVNVCILTKKFCKNWSLTGILGRASGLFWDIRKEFPYELYANISFLVPIAKNGDSYDRYLLRVEEMRQSLNIIYQGFNFYKSETATYFTKSFISKINSPSRSSMKANMETIIDQFKLFIKNYSLDEASTYTFVESPKGEFGISLISNNTNKFTRCKIRAPGFFHLQALNALLGKNGTIADLVVILGTLDIVFGEIDR